MVRLPSKFNLLYCIIICLFYGLLFCQKLYAQTGDIDYKISVGLYNPKNEMGNIKSYYKPYVNYGLQYKMNDSFNVNLDSYISDETKYLIYFGTSIEYRYKLNNKYDLFTLIGADFMERNLVPKIGVGILAKISNKLSFTLDSIKRNSLEYSDYQLEIGFVYNFLRKTVPVVSSLDQKYSVNDSMNYLRRVSDDNLRRINALNPAINLAMGKTEFYFKVDILDTFNNLEVIVDGVKWHTFALKNKKVLMTTDMLPKGNYIITFILTRYNLNGNLERTIYTEKHVEMKSKQGTNFTFSILQSNLGENLHVKQW